MLGVYWVQLGIQLAQDRTQCRNYVNSVMDDLITIKPSNSSTTYGLPPVKSTMFTVNLEIEYGTHTRQRKLTEPMTQSLDKPDS